MSLIAGVDIGNSTTEIVVADGKSPIAWDRRPTRGRKGSESSIRAAAALLRSIERKIGSPVERVVVAPWKPVLTETTAYKEPPPDTGRIKLLECADHSVMGDGWAVGQPWNISQQPSAADSLIAVVATGTGYQQAASIISDAIRQGMPITAVIVADDEAVLIASRIKAQIPVVDGVDVSSALEAKRLFIEVRPPGQCVNVATDVWALHSAFETESNETEFLGVVARWSKDLRAIVIAKFDNAETVISSAQTPMVTWHNGQASALADAIPVFSQQPVGAVRSLTLQHTVITEDVWGVDVTAILVERGARATSKVKSLALASLTNANSESSISLNELFDKPVSVVSSEADMASIGARTTPGLSDDALILDIGGGTIDLIGNVGSITAAGAGDLLTAAVAQVIDTSRGAADWIKRGPAQRVESSQVLLSENGSYDFVSSDHGPLPANLTGRLVVKGPSGLMPFAREMQPAEWRIIRQSLKLEVIAKNVSRILATYMEKIALKESVNLVIVGGPAADDELLPTLGRLSMVSGIGRGNVAGTLGHRYGVAYGLTQSADNH